MKALMFGWEFPPHILGGLGTASYGLTKGMHKCGDMDITFVIPKPWGDEEKGFANIIGANNTPVVWRDVDWNTVENQIGNTMNPQTYYDLRNNIYADFNNIHIIYSSILFTFNFVLLISNISTVLSIEIFSLATSFIAFFIGLEKNPFFLVGG